MKNDFLPIFNHVIGLEGNWFPLIGALHQPDSPESQQIIGSFRDVLRADVPHLLQETQRVVSSSISFERKALALHLFLEAPGATKEQAAVLLGKLTLEEQTKLQGEAHEEFSGVLALDVDPLKALVATHLQDADMAILETMGTFQATSQNATVLVLHARLSQSTRDRILEFQTAVVNDKAELMASKMPGISQVGGWLGTRVGASAFDHFSAHRSAKPSGEVAMEAVKRMITEQNEAIIVE